MKTTITFFALLLVVIPLRSQVSFKTLVPQQPLVSGESFQVQYIIEDGENASGVKAPAFYNFRFVAGPNTYMGSVSTVNGMKPLKNIVYTLEAMSPGKFNIPGATIIVNGKTIRSNDVQVEVISKKEAIRRFKKENGISNSDYFLRPGEDGYEKIRQNMFVKMLVDKRSCFVGEPVLATFKLYSRLESKSDIVKNPGFYGFTVYDMVNLSDKQLATENVNGKIFDVHTIRKVQLYPLQAGVFMVDEMRIKNKVEFSRSVVNKKTEQKIVESVLGNNDMEMPVAGTDVFETEISTEPVSIVVKPVPDKNKPTIFTGAVGHFTIKASLANNKLSKNEEGFFEITIGGKGNFTQLDAPLVQWPAGMEGFEPVVKDDLDKTKLPLTGSRTFRYPFVCVAAGIWPLPQVSFSFFDIDSNKYKIIATKTIDVLIGNENKKVQVLEKPKTSIAETSEKAARTAGIVVVSLVLVILLYWIFRKKEPEKLVITQQVQELASTESLLESAYAALPEEGNKFYSILHGIIWKFAAVHFDLSGTEMNKEALAAKMNLVDVGDDVKEKLFQILNQCEVGMFTDAILENDKEVVLTQSKQVLEKIRSALL